MANSIVFSGMIALSILSGGFPGAAWDEAGREKVKMLWIGGNNVLTSRSQVAALFDRCQKAGLNSVALEVKPPSGALLFGGTFDLLAVAAEEAAARKLKLKAVVSLFCEGIKKEHLGPAFDHPKWPAVIFDQTSVASLNGRELGVTRGEAVGGISMISGNEKSERFYEAKSDGVLALIARNKVDLLIENPHGFRFPIPKDGFLLVGDAASSDAMRGLRLGDPVELKNKKQVVSEVQYPSGKYLRVNPNLPEIQERLLSILKQLAAYPITGILVEDAGFGSQKADFSDTSRRMFEASQKREVINWPTDILDYGANGELLKGPSFQAWQDWRCKSTRDFLEKAKKTIGGKKMSFGILMEDSYASSLENGLNWGGLAGIADEFVALPPENEGTELLRQRIGNLALTLGVSELSGKAIAPRLKEAEGVMIPLELLSDPSRWNQLGETLQPN